MSEIIQGIRVIKMYAWEKSFAKLVALARRAEINVIQKSCFFKAFNMCFFFTSSRIVMAIIFLTYVLMGDILTAEKAFLTLGLFNVVRLSMCMFFPNAIALMSESLISIKRIQDFLLLEELSESSAENCITHDLSNKTMANGTVSGGGTEGSFVKMANVCGKWTSDEAGNTIENVTFEAMPGKLTAIIGPVGSGKVWKTCTTLKLLCNHDNIFRRGRY